MPDKDFYQSLEAEGAEAYEAISEDRQRVGGAIITANGVIGEYHLKPQHTCKE